MEVIDFTPLFITSAQQCLNFKNGIQPSYCDSIEPNPIQLLIDHIQSSLTRKCYRHIVDLENIIQEFDNYNADYNRVMLDSFVDECKDILNEILYNIKCKLHEVDVSQHSYTETWTKLKYCHTITTVLKGKGEYQGSISININNELANEMYQLYATTVETFKKANLTILSKFQCDHYDFLNKLNSITLIISILLISKLYDLIELIGDTFVQQLQQCISIQMRNTYEEASKEITLTKIVTILQDAFEKQQQQILRTSVQNMTNQIQQAFKTTYVKSISFNNARELLGITLHHLKQELRLTPMILPNHTKTSKFGISDLLYQLKSMRTNLLNISEGYLSSKNKRMDCNGSITVFANHKLCLIEFYQAIQVDKNDLCVKDIKLTREILEELLYSCRRDRYRNLYSIPQYVCTRVIHAVCQYVNSLRLTL